MALLAGCSHLPSSDAIPETAIADIRAQTEIARFSANASSGLPHHWHPLVLFRTKKQTQYELVSDYGRTVLHARATAASSGLMQYVNIDPLPAPWLNWEWKIGRAVETGSDTHAFEDSPGRVILGFDGDKDSLSFADQILFETARVFTGYDFPYATLMYIWDTRVPVGTIIDSNRSGRIKMMVVANGASGAGQWQTFTRNIVADFEKAFGEKPGNLIGVGVLTDTDGSGVTVDTWYGDIRLRAEPP
jgi:hypothetical protein